MEKNVGGLDLRMRVASGALAGLMSLVILADYLQADELFALVLGVLSIMLLGNAYSQKCPVCHALGHNSYEK